MKKFKWSPNCTVDSDMADFGVLDFLIDKRYGIVIISVEKHGKIKDITITIEKAQEIGLINFQALNYFVNPTSKNHKQEVVEKKSLIDSIKHKYGVFVNNLRLRFLNELPS